jgi:hypothetical protein
MTKYDSGKTYTLGFRAVQDKVPSASGVYVLYTPRQWVYVGESDDVRQSLFRHLNEPDACLKRCGPLSFSFELISPPERHARHAALTKELRPICGSRSTGVRGRPFNAALPPNPADPIPRVSTPVAHRVGN